MKKTIKKTVTTITILLPIFISLVIGCQKSELQTSGDDNVNGNGSSTFATFRDIPGATAEEIAAIEKLQARGTPLIYAAPPFTETFVRVEDGTYGGFTVLLTEWLSELFGLEFILRVETLNVRLEKLQSGEFAFTTFSESPERRQHYFTTSPIIQRTLLMMSIDGRPTLDEIKTDRLPRFAFLENSTNLEFAAASMKEDSYETILVPNEETAYQMLSDGRADFFIASNSSEAAFDRFGGVRTEDFLPHVFMYAVMATQNPEYAAVISLVNKAMEHNATRHLTDLYRRGYEEYRRNKFFMRLTDEEKTFLRDNPVIPFATQRMSYPLSFYNERENVWEGVVFDILDELKRLTGVEFERINDNTVDQIGLMKLLENGDAYFMPNLIRTEDRRERFIWSEILYQHDRFALLSKRSYRNIELNDIPFEKIGVSKGSAHGELFYMWFPNALHVTEYPNNNALFTALDRGEINLAMSSRNRLTAMINYHEFSDYKANILFNAAFEATFAFNKDHAVLQSIVDKALPLINTDRIMEQWLSRTYNIEAMRLRQQRPWLVGAIIFTFALFVLMLILFINHRKKRKIEKLLALAEKNREREKLTQSMLDAAPFGAVIWDSNFKIVNTNKELIRYFEMANKEEFINNFYKMIPEFQPNGERSQDVVKATLQKAFDEGFHECEFEHVNLKGVTIPCKITLVRIESAGENLVVAYSRDLRQHRAYLAEIENAKTAAVEANRAKTAFLANMSHEIRTPINSIIGFSELAHDGDMDAKTKKHLGNISENAEMLLAIINDILDISKIESGRMELERIPFDLEDVFAFCHSVVLPKAQEKGLKLVCAMDTPLSKKLIGDPMRLQQAFTNMLFNAVKFTNSGSVELRSRIKGADSGFDGDGITLHFEIRDTGIGMDNAQIERVFKPFMQADNSISRKYGGTGLGLAITQNIIKMMGGELSVESTPGVGSTFAFDLKFDVATDKNGLAEKNDFGKTEKPIFEGEVLICEDSEMNRQVICEHLERVGVKFVVAKNGAEGIEIVKRRMDDNKEMFSIVFMDIHMPVMDGVQATAKLLALGVDAPIVALTANVMASELEFYKSAGMSDFLGKPFRARELWKLLANYLPIKEIVKIDKVREAASDDKMLKSLRKNFVGNNANAYDNIVAALESGDVKLAHRLAHSLKSNAGQIGELDLQNAALDVEVALAGGQKLTDDRKLAALKNKLDAAVVRLNSILADDKSEVKEQITNNEEIKVLFDKLEPMLRHRNPECMNLLDEIKAISGTEKLARHVENFEFKPALEEFITLKEKLNV